MRHKGRFKKNTFVKLTALSFALSPMAAEAQNLSCPQPMVFGSIMPCAGTGTITVEPDGSSTSGGCITVGGAPQSFARCIVTQSFPYRPVQIQITAATFTINNGGTGSMDVNSFDLITNNGDYTQTRTAPFVNVPIGGTLNVKASQASGSYTGTFTISAILQ